MCRRESIVWGFYAIGARDAGQRKDSSQGRVEGTLVVECAGLLHSLGGWPKKSQCPGVITNLLQKTGRGTSGASSTTVVENPPNRKSGDREAKTLPRTLHWREVRRGAPGAYWSHFGPSHGRSRRDRIRENQCPGVFTGSRLGEDDTGLPIITLHMATRCVNPNTSVNFREQFPKAD